MVGRRQFLVVWKGGRPAVMGDRGANMSRVPKFRYGPGVAVIRHLKVPVHPAARLGRRRTLFTLLTGVECHCSRLSMSVWGREVGVSVACPKCKFVKVWNRGLSPCQRGSDPHTCSEALKTAHFLSSFTECRRQDAFFEVFKANFAFNATKR